MKDLFYCKDCDCLVDENHRCQQWSTVSRIPSGAIKHLSTIVQQPLSGSPDGSPKSCPMYVKNDLCAYYRDVKCQDKPCIMRHDF